MFEKWIFQAEDGIRDSYGDWSSDVCSSDYGYTLKWKTKIIRLFACIMF